VLQYYFKIWKKPLLSFWTSSALSPSGTSESKFSTNSAANAIFPRSNFATHASLKARNKVSILVQLTFPHVDKHKGDVHCAHNRVGVVEH